MEYIRELRSTAVAVAYLHLVTYDHEYTHHIYEYNLVCSLDVGVRMMVDSPSIQLEDKKYLHAITLYVTLSSDHKLYSINIPINILVII